MRARLANLKVTQEKMKAETEMQMRIEAMKSEEQMLNRELLDKIKMDRDIDIDIDIDIEDLFTVEYYKPINISSVALFLRQTYVKQQIITEHAT